MIEDLIYRALLAANPRPAVEKVRRPIGWHIPHQAVPSGGPLCFDPPRLPSAKVTA